MCGPLVHSRPAQIFSKLAAHRASILINWNSGIGIGGYTAYFRLTCVRKAEIVRWSERSAFPRGEGSSFQVLEQRAPPLSEGVTVNRIVTRLMMLASIFALAGCAALSARSGGSSSGGGTPVATALSANPAPPSIFDRLEKSTKVEVVGPPAFLDENVQLDASVINEQCSFPHT